MKRLLILTLYVALAAGAATAQVSVRVATWNIESVGPQGSAEYNAAGQILGRIDADIVAINEVGSDTDESHFYDLAANAGYLDCVVAPPAFGSMRNAFLSKYPILHYTAHTSVGLSGDPNANDITYTILEIVVRPPDSDRDLTVVVNMWKSGTGNDDEFRRTVESYRVAQSVADLDPSVDAYVLAGDVNEEIDEVPRTPNPFTSLPSGLPSAFFLGSDLVVELGGPGIVNDPFWYLEPAVVLPALQLDGFDTTRPASSGRLDYIAVSDFIFARGVQTEVYDSSDEGLPGLPKSGSPLPPPTSMDASDHLLVFVDIDLPSEATSAPTSVVRRGAALHPNHPNPFNPATVIEYEVPHAGRVKLSVYTVAGQLVDILVDERQTAGPHTFVWNARNAVAASLPSGVYVSVLEAAGKTVTRKMVLLK
jgi:endonuclease/exonuclease/phosphatase family metal-dependent hydrolase